MKTATEIFEEITRIPRESGHEEKIASYLEEFARSHGLYCLRDSANNILIRKPGSSEPVILQGHSDMVCEKESSSDHDFSADPIPLIRDGRYLTADRTTLGADDGISMAVMMALLSDDSVTASLECLITSEEETGLCGMKAFDFSLLKGRTMINLDSMDEGIATVSCCGGMRSDITVPAGRRPGHLRGYALHLKGFYGGHSGEDINLGRTNAIEAALGLLGTVPGVKIDKIHGGSKDNAIPRECDIYFASDAQNVKELISAENEKLRERVSDDDRNYSAEVEECLLDSVFEDGLYERLVSLIGCIPHGVTEMNPDIPGLVKTSANIGKIRTSECGVSITVSSRSSDEAALDAQQETINSAADEAGGYALHRDRYPGWAFSKEGRILKVYLEAYESLFSKKAVYEGIHAGLECGIVKAAVPDMDIISIGADIRSPHTPDETLDTESLERLLATVKEILRRIEL